ncbi:MAG: response regulator transcription factor [Saprospirales bacterium]|nr:response regulator transcription factor [Saprospirales bacterium]MBK8920820.1 response regulator transcription factor [Saprospirales bacterium]
MSNYDCYIVDDEPIAIDILCAYVERLEGFRIVGTFTNPIKAFEAIHRNPAHLVFLDIQMPELTGLDLLRSLRRRPQVILTTAYREFALEGFDFDVTDYLLKPIAFERFLQAIDKFHLRAALPGPDHTLIAAGSTDDPPYFFVRADRKSVKVYLQDILYLESLKDYVRIVTTQGKILTKETISHFEQFLPSDAFIRAHRSFIVSKDKISAISVDGLEIGQQTIPVGRMYKMAVEKTVLG